jgi:hypothetical protein
VTRAAESLEHPPERIGGPPAALVPHAPLLLAELCPQGFEQQTQRVRGAIATLPWRAVDLVVLLSPHGERSGVYREVSGSLSGFGVTGIAGEFPTPESRAEDLASDWGVPVLSPPVDHGILVPLLLGAAAGRPVVAATIAETTGSGGDLGSSLDDARRLAACLRRFGPRVGFVASANSSAALTPRAPFGVQDAALEVEEELLAALQADVGRLDGLASRLLDAGRSCAGPPLGCLARLRAGTAGRLCAYERPAGVGYPVAFVE